MHVPILADMSTPPPIPAIDKIAYSIREASESSGMSAEVIRRAIRSGELPSYRPTAKHLILPEDLLAYIKSRAT